MSLEQPRMPQAVEQEPVKYKDVFQVFGKLAGKPIMLEDATMMQAAKTTVFCQVQKDGLADVVQVAATYNERTGIVTIDMAGEKGVTVTEIDLPGTHIISESVVE